MNSTSPPLHLKFKQLLEITKEEEEEEEEKEKEEEEEEEEKEKYDVM